MGHLTREKGNIITRREIRPKLPPHFSPCMVGQQFGASYIGYIGIFRIGLTHRYCSNYFWDRSRPFLFDKVDNRIDHQVRIVTFEGEKEGTWSYC